MAVFQVFDQFPADLGAGVHQLASHSFRVVLSNVAPNIATNTVLADITQIAATGGYAAGGYTLDGEAFAETGAGTGIWQFTITDEVILAAGGSIGPFRYVVIYNDTAANDPLVGFLDFGQAVTITDTNTFTIDVGANGVFRIGRGTIS